MASQALSHNKICSECGAVLSDSMRYCPTCTTDAGAPNVRFCRTDENINALTARFDDAMAKASAKKCLTEFCNLSDLMEKQSGVVVSMPAGVARKMFEDPKFLFNNYEKLVGANARKPADSENDRHRCAVSGQLFGSYAKYIVYGALSLTEEGISTYGDVYCRLRSVTIDKRTSFLETNSYTFVRDHNIVPGDKLPPGYMACWNHRHTLVLAKLADSLSTGQTESDWQAILIQSDVNDRNNDSFVEAHIYEGFDKNAIKYMVAVTGKKLRREDRMDIKIALSKFKSLGGKTN